ncbi:MAG: hypothetical protein JW973_01750 [Bacteroidales bacterium]|nr:hypothetical protein [Bacteroidales bacterium]
MERMRGRETAIGGDEASEIRGTISIAPGFSQGKKEAEKNAASNTKPKAMPLFAAERKKSYSVNREL